MLKTSAWSITPVWLMAIAGAIIIGLSPFRGGWTLWIPVACGLSVIIALALQVATKTPEGFILRAGVAICGVVVIFAIASLVLLIVGLP